MTDTPRWKPVEPPSGSGPSDDDIAARAQFEELLAAAPAGLQTSAEKWSSGLVGLIGVITAGMVLKGQAATANLELPWRLTLIALSVIALTLAVYALWRLLSVAARRYRNTSRAQLFGEPGAYEHHRVQAAAKDASTITYAIHFGAAALALQVLAVALWWAAPVAPKTPPAFIVVTTGDKATCGEVLSGDQGALRLKVAGESEPRTLPLARTDNLKVVDECS